MWLHRSLGSSYCTHVRRRRGRSHTGRPPTTPAGPPRFLRLRNSVPDQGPASAQVLVLEEKEERVKLRAQVVATSWGTNGPLGAWGKPLGRQGLAQPVVTSAVAFGGEAAR
eukprot:COSAG03_NODE_580_length_6871_cov_10.166716_5_plen_111_part_00